MLLLITHQKEFDQIKQQNGNFMLIEAIKKNGKKNKAFHEGILPGASYAIADLTAVGPNTPPTGDT